MNNHFSTTMNFNCNQAEKICTILIVDDSETDRLTYLRYLNKSTTSYCGILESDCGESGLRICKHNQPDVILLDYLLPDMDGLEFLEMLRTEVKHPPPVIMLTGHGNEQIAVEALKMGAQDYLVKSELDPKKLDQAIQQILTKQALEQVVARQRQQQDLLTDIALRISKSLDLDTILNNVVEGVQQLLQCDRSLIYKFESDLSGTVLAESVLPSFSVSLGSKIEDTCFQENGAERYLKGHRTVLSDIYRANLTPCHIRMLERFQVRANLIVPILLQEVKNSGPRQLWGLLIAHHCQNPRDWQLHELELLDNLTVQLAIAIQQQELISSLQQQTEALTSTNKRLIDLTNLLQVRNQELDKFAYVTSHDLRSPLRAINSLAEWLQEDLSGQISPENQKQLDLIQSRVERMQNFIGGLLQYSRVGRQSLELAPVDLRTLVAEIINDLAPPPELQISLPEQMPIIYTYKLLLQQVLTNLIGNAIKYHDRPDGRVSISLEDRGEMVEFVIVDNGPGIEPEYHERIFEIFQTLNSRDTLESTGIGLSIVKKIVEEQGGTITVQSTLGKGSIFSFTWPKNRQVS